MRKNMRKRQGFTLIELLAVIVILAVIALIATPLILGIIERTQKSAYEASLRSVFSATELYIASADFNDIPEEGIPIIDENIRLKNKEFTSGKIVKNEQGEIVLHDVSNGVYCGNGTLDNLHVIKGSCYSTDTTPPTDVTIGFGTITSNSIEIVANALDVESAISGYEFSIDNGSTWTSKQTSNVYTFTNLTNNTEYTFKIRATNNNDLTTESNTLLVSTNDIPLPTYSINTTNWTDSVIVSITYPERQPGYIYEYSLDGATTWEEVASPSTTKDITFNTNGNVIARISDGTNIVSGTTYEVTNIDVTPPVITVNPTDVTTFINNAYTDSGVTASDAETGDVTGDIITTGNVDTSTVGTYTLTYNVSDAAGNTAIEVTRTVNVIYNVFTFTNAGKTGNTGPSQAQIDSAYTGTSLANNVTVSSGIQSWAVPYTGIYQIEVWGAEGGSTSYAGGYGARTSGEFNFNAGEIVKILVGQKGLNGSGSNDGGGGGGGGTFAYKSSGNTLLIAAGGGGGASNIENGEQGQSGTSGSAGGGTSGTSGNAGNQGAKSSCCGCSAGAGWSQNSGAYGSSWATSAYTCLNGGNGATVSSGSGGYGGFGGGGAGAYGGGGGGGYSGGGAGCGSPSYQSGGGGGSYNIGSNPSSSSGVRSGHGQVVITLTP